MSNDGTVVIDEEEEIVKEIVSPFLNIVSTFVHRR
jgi:hypothetical protein